MRGFEIAGALALAWLCSPSFAQGSAQETATADSGTAAPYSAELFAKLPLINGPKLSPDGQNILFSTQTGGRTFVATRSVTDGKLHSIPLAERLDLNWYRWAGNNRLLISVSQIRMCVWLA